MDQIIALLSGAGRILPVTVIAAIVLFVLKEIVEGRRRREANSRKRTAIRRLIGDEIERNNWTIKRTRDCVAQIQRAIGEPGSTLDISVSPIGERVLRRKGPDGSITQMPLAKVHISVLSTSLMDVAIVDESIFSDLLFVSDLIK